MTGRRAALGALAILFGAPASANPDLLLDSGRYLSKYPGLTVGLSLLRDPRDESFGSDSRRQAGVVPTYGAGNEFPMTRATVDLDWHFPMFETEALPFVRLATTSDYAGLGTSTATMGFGSHAEVASAPEKNCYLVPDGLSLEIAAGIPIEAIASTETFAVPEDFVGKRDTYVLRVRGDSMIDEQIKEADRELAMRRRLYPGWIARKTLSEATAKKQLRILEAIIQTLDELVAAQLAHASHGAHTDSGPASNPSAVRSQRSPRAANGASCVPNT